MTTKRILTILIIVITVMVYIRCKQPYISPVGSSASNYLVVEGSINTNDSTIIRLSRTVQLSDTVRSKPELNATVYIQDQSNVSYYLTETKNGYYSAPNFNLNPANKYRLMITTNDQKIYQSDAVAVKNSPPIDSVYYEVTNSGLQVYSNTHDRTGNTRYYLWDYTETWQVHSEYVSLLEGKTNPDTVTYRPEADQFYYCWPTANSSTIIVNSSAKLSQDIITRNPVAFVSSSSPKFSLEYSILLRQHALTKEAFEYWQNLKKNTEQLGSIFDSQPSQIQGNIHSVSTNPSEIVLGYISAGSISNKRIFIGRSKLPGEWYNTIPSPYTNCKIDTALLSNKLGMQAIYNGVITPIAPIFGMRGIIGYSTSTQFCVDCRLNGGPSKRPLFWIDNY